MRIAILGATSEIAKDIINLLGKNPQYQLRLFSRRPELVSQWASSLDLSAQPLSLSLDQFDHSDQFDAIINFIGAGNPQRIQQIGDEILDVTHQYDNMAINYLQRFPKCRYIFLSSGSIFGPDFALPVDMNSCASLKGNTLLASNWYSKAKLAAECEHRLHNDLSIVDIRVFNYFSRSQNLLSNFLITDIARAIQAGSILLTSSENIVRDYIHPTDFFSLLIATLHAEPLNTALDCYSQSPVDKLTLLNALQEHFDLQFQFTETGVDQNPTGSKSNYYSLNKSAASLGYEPNYSSLSGILLEMNSLRSGLTHF
jgi:nucleoside-diphosphate-sugar epimerase